MGWCLRPALCLSVAVLFPACSSTPPVKQPPEWAYEKGAIQLRLASDPQLNLYQKRAHSLILCLYHLRDPNGFNQLAEDRDGLARLLECNRFDPSVTYARRLVIQPNQELSEAMDRTEGARFVGLVAGYYALNKQGAVRSYAVPVAETRRGSLLVQQAGKLDINLQLGRQAIAQPKSSPDAPAHPQ